MAKQRTKVEPVKTAPSVYGSPRIQAAPKAGGDDELGGWLEDAIPLGLGLLIVVLARVVTPNIRDLFQLPKQLYLADGAALLVALVGALAWMGRPLRFRTSPMVWAGVAFMAAMAMSLVTAPKQTGGMLSIFARYDAHRWLAAGAIFWVTLVGVRRPRHVWYLMGGLMIGGLVVSLIGIGEQHNILGLMPEKRWVIISKPGSTFGNRNMAAQVVAAMLPACYVAMAMAVRWFVHRRTVLAVCVLVPAAITLDLFLYYLILTVTRSAWAGAILGLLAAGSAWVLGVVMAHRQSSDAEPVVDVPSEVPVAPPVRGLMQSRLKDLAVPIAGLVLLTGGVAMVADHYKPAAETVEEGDQKRNKTVPQLVKSFFEFGSDHYRWRFGMLASSWEAMKAEPLGGGAGNWRVMYPKYLTQREKNEMFTIAKQPIRAHNDVLQVGAEFGFQGVIALFALLLSAFGLTARAIYRAAKVTSERAEGAALLSFAAMGSLIGIVAIMGDAMASFPLQLPVPTFLFCLHLGLIAAADGLLAPPEPVAERNRGWPQWVAVSTVTLGLGSLVFLEGFGSSEGLHGRWLIAEHGFTDARNSQKRGQASQGLVEIGRAIDINPDDFQNHFIEALCLNSMGKTKEAIDSLHRSLALYPNLLNAWVNVAMFSARIQDKARMNEAIDKALALKPDELVALNVRLSDYNQQGKHGDVIALVAKQVPGYQAYRASGKWPLDDNGQLLGSYKQTLTHGIAAARKLDKWAELAAWLDHLDAVGVPDDGRSEEAKRKEKRERASEIAEALRKQAKYTEALPWAKRAAELAMHEYPELKRNYALTLAWAGKFDDAAHEGAVAVSLDRGEKDKLITGVQAMRESGKRDGAALDKLTQALQAL